MPASTPIVQQWVMNKALMRLKNSLGMARHADREPQKDFDKPFAKGQTILRKLPMRHQLVRQVGFTPSSLNQRSVPITIDRPIGVHLTIEAQDKMFRLPTTPGEWEENFYGSAMDTIGQGIESDFAQFVYENTSNSVGTIGVDATDSKILDAARQRLVELGSPQTPGYNKIFLSPNSTNSIGQGQRTIFNPTVVSDFYREGLLGRVATMDAFESVSMPFHTSASAWGGAVTVNTATVNGDSVLNLACTVGDTFNKNDILTIAACKAVNPLTRAITGPKRQFRVTETAVASGATVNVKIAPQIFGPGDPNQNVDALPAAGAVVLLFESGGVSQFAKTGMQNLCFNKEAFAVVFAEYPNATSTERCQTVTDKNSRVSIQLVEFYDPLTKNYGMRWDAIYGFGNQYGDDCSVRIQCAA